MMDSATAVDSAAVNSVREIDSMEEAASVTAEMNPFPLRELKRAQEQTQMVSQDPRSTPASIRFLVWCRPRQSDS
jgi:hypothetical protein